MSAFNDYRDRTGEAYRFLATARPTLVTAPESEPITLEDAKLHLRVTDDAEDRLIERLIQVARQRVEADTGRALLTQAYDLVQDTVPGGDTLLLPRPPLQSVTSVTSYNASDTATVLASSKYIVDTSATPGRLTLKSTASWPTDLRDARGFIVRFAAGYGADSEDVPAPLLHAMLLALGGYYAHREHVIVAQFAGQFLELPAGYGALIAHYRVWA